MRRRALLLTGLLLLVACDDQREAHPPPTTAQPLPAPPSSSSTTIYPTSVDPTRGFSVERVIVQGAGPDDVRGSHLFKQVRFAAGEGYDRVVFEFESAMPYGGFYVEYSSEPDGLGDAGCVSPKRSEGADLVVSLHGTGTSEGVYPDLGRRSYTGRDRVRPTSTKQIREAVFSCEFEATVEWVLVIREKRSFRVTTLSDPPRLLVDVQWR